MSSVNKFGGQLIGLFLHCSKCMCNIYCSTCNLENIHTSQMSRVQHCLESSAQTELNVQLTYAKCVGPVVSQMYELHNMRYVHSACYIIHGIWLRYKTTYHPHGHCNSQ